MPRTDISSIRLFVSFNLPGKISFSECLTFKDDGELSYICTANRPICMIKISEDIIPADPASLFSLIADYTEDGTIDPGRYDGISEHFDAPYWCDHVCIHTGGGDKVRISLNEENDLLEHMLVTIRGIYPKDERAPRPFIIFEDEDKPSEVEGKYRAYLDKRSR